ncbi:unnamed protein product [Camellia sinensis]
MAESSASYIHMVTSCFFFPPSIVVSMKKIFKVQHLIEECIIFNMSREECMEALSKHANIQPVITSTVWKELEKENKEFFEGYTKRREERAERK